MPKVIKGGAGGALSSVIPQPSPRGAPPPVRGRKSIIEKEIVSAEEEARRIVLDAEQEAARLLEEANAQADELRQKGYDDGYQEGLGQYTEETARALLEVEKMRGAIEPAYIGLVTACVEKIMGEELKLNPEIIVGIVRSALRDATQQREINVRAHPADVETLRKHQRRLLDVLGRANMIEIREDHTVARGGCIVVTELGTIDASLERQLSALASVLEDELGNVVAEATAEDGS